MLILIYYAVSQIGINEVLVGDSSFLCQRFEIIEDVYSHANI